MPTMILLALCSLIICFVLTPFFRDFFGFLGLMDQPDSQRKTHSHPTPRVGGIALVVSYLAAVTALILGWRSGLLSTQDPSIRLMATLLPAVILIFITGLYDDFWGLSPWRKIAGQVVAAAYAVWMGVHLAAPPGYSGPILLIDLISVFWLVLCANAFNLIDGLDGLATGVALIAAAGLLMAALIHHHLGLALVITPLLGSLVGFLYYNFNPASVFLGDCGSLLVGFLLGCYGLMWSQHATTGLGRVAPLIALALPVLEVGSSVMRRLLRNQPIFGPDRNHIHHRIQSLGLNQRHAALVLYGVSALAALLAVLQTILRPQPATVLLLIFLSVAYLGFRSLHYAEFGILGQFLFAGEFRRTLRTRIVLREYEESLAQARSIEQCWQALKQACGEMNFNYVSLRVSGKRFEDALQPSTSLTARLRVALSRSGTAVFGHDPGQPAPAMVIAPLAERLRERLRSLRIEPAEAGKSGRAREKARTATAAE